jgi:hypothetical protein
MWRRTRLVSFGVAALLQPALSKAECDAIIAEAEEVRACLGGAIAKVVLLVSSGHHVERWRRCATPTHAFSAHTRLAPGRGCSCFYYWQIAARDGWGTERHHDVPTTGQYHDSECNSATNAAALCVCVCECQCECQCE